MDILLLTLPVLLASGLAPLLTARWFRCCKALHTTLLSAGCLGGLYSLFTFWQHPATATFSCSWLHTFTLSFALDSLGAVFLLPVFLLVPVISLYGYHYLDQATHFRRTALSHFFFSLLTIAMILVTLADNMVTFALAWELMSLSSFALVMHDWEKEQTQSAGYLYLLFTQTGALCIFAAFGLVFQATGSLAFAQMSSIPPGIKLAVFCLTLAGFGSKAGLFPLHVWLPHAHPAAPSHVSALMSGVMIKMGIYGLVRFYFLLDSPTPIFARTILVLGMISGLLGVVYALGKHDLKRLLAYHSIENIGIILIGCGLGMLGLASGNRIMAAFGFAGGILHVLNHALFKSLLFLGAGSILQATGLRHLDQLGGLMRTMPVTGRTFLTGAVAISGLPPLNGFISEFLIYYAAFQGLVLGGTDFLFSMAAIISLALIGGLAAGCFTKVVGIVLLGEPRHTHGREQGDAALSMRAAMVFLALVCVLIGLWPEPFVRFAFAGLASLKPFTAIPGEVSGTIAHHLAVAGRLFLGLLIVLMGCRWLLYRNKPVSQSGTWGCGFTQATSRIQYTGTSYARSLVEFHRPLVRVRTTYPGLGKIFPGSVAYVSKVEDVAELGLHCLLIRPLLKGVEKLRWIQHGHIQLYIGYIVLTIAVLLLVV
ncbi:NADH/Ubiquinone/plastoquinone (complex I) [Desulfobulbus propionicus DSM 2032]|uniref:NADH/Ubiquinone/plastoquinone (Complex I) n=1 Tax=Desulfobulbus propionicus (strain ATCC 33891 / DSM 2032 / VKM B-1956 / 1pr3) TaxID=577650 RepID=A0A7U3YPT8_DESPD|nr:proton-conducting transporter membrane subunit [Desulfobulbus propionicus]ADW19330.1 NADH/Ubiquinone/plastoquinone (complex I) [Desulfobulbus propionicus DSM 2032]